MLVFNAAPGSLNINIIQGSSFTIHANGNSVPFKISHILPASKLASLIAVDNVRAIKLCYGCSNYFQTIFFIKKWKMKCTLYH